MFTETSDALEALQTRVQTEDRKFDADQSPPIAAIDQVRYARTLRLRQFPVLLQNVIRRHPLGEASQRSYPLRQLNPQRTGGRVQELSYKHQLRWPQHMNATDFL